MIPPIIHTLGVDVEFSMSEVDASEEIGAVQYDNESGLESTVLEMNGGVK